MLIKDKNKVVVEYCRGKTVLDLGCAGHICSIPGDDTSERSSKWLHKQIKSVAKELIGVDLLKKEVERLKKKEYNIIYGNAETINLNRKFDVIVAGDLIEHISNVGMFMQNMKRHLAKKGIIIINTPNAFAGRHFIRTLTHSRHSTNPDHVGFYEFNTLKQLGERFGLKVVKTYYSYFNSKEYPSKAKFLTESALCRFSEIYAPQIMVIMQHAK